MATNRKLHIGMSLAPTWLSGDAWRRSDSGAEALYRTDFYLDTAQRAEAAKLDFVFLPDVLYQNTKVLETSAGFASLDPTLLLASIARETSYIGLLSTASTTFYPPYVIARQIQSLNWISNGRAGWNIVTAIDGHENFGLEAMPSAEDRYARAAEFTDVVKRLWDSFPSNALKLDKASGRFADPSFVKPINHHGAHFKVKGPLNLPSYGKVPIPLIQAGASPAGRNFAASVADAIFASVPDRDAGVELRMDLRRRAENHGRNADDIRILPGLSLYLAATQAEAHELYAQTHARLDQSRALASIQQMTGLDLASWPRDKPVTAADLPPAPEHVRSRTHAELLRRLIGREAPTVEELLKKPEVIGSAHWQIVGTVGDAVDQIISWTDAGAMDGFITVPGGSVGSMRLALEAVIPALADAGLFRRDYAATTFFGHLKE